MKPKLPDDICSYQDFQSALAEIRLYAKWLTQAQLKKRFSGGQVPQAPAVSRAAQELMAAAGLQEAPDHQALETLINSLARFSENAPRMTITLAAPPPGSLKKQLVSWCRRNIGPDVLVSVKFNSTILGGMVVSSGSHTYDWSFRRQILAARQKFPEILRNV